MALDFTSDEYMKLHRMLDTMMAESEKYNVYEERYFVNIHTFLNKLDDAGYAIVPKRKNTIQTLLEEL